MSKIGMFVKILSSSEMWSEQRHFEAFFRFVNSRDHVIKPKVQSLLSSFLKS